jgi:putative transposase
LRDRDAIYSDAFRRRVAGIGIGEVISSPSSPWQNPYAERLIGSIRRECLDHVVVLSERHLRRVLAAYIAYYHESRTHLGLEKDTPNRRSVQPPSAGGIVTIPEVGGLHHRYERRRRMSRGLTSHLFPGAGSQSRAPAAITTFESNVV